MEAGVKEALEGLAAAEDRSLSSYMARVLKLHVENGQEAPRLMASPARTFTHASARRRP